MALNSWNVVRPWYTGKLELLKPEQRTASSDFSVSPSTTWTTLDLTAVIGTDVVAVLLLSDVEDAHEAFILSTREVGDSAAVTDMSAWTSGMRGTAVTNARRMSPVIILCGGVDPGKFQYAEYNSGTWDVDTFAGNVWGRVRP